MSGGTVISALAGARSHAIEVRRCIQDCFLDVGRRCTSAARMFPSHHPVFHFSTISVTTQTSRTTRRD
ncbi:hypothetical protein KC359_g239 [Hortaea werneckii]|nr:hypothetical protein KC359_g239 [Hortaea werneckii]